MLETGALGSLKQGSPVYYRQVKVGDYRFSALAHGPASVDGRQHRGPYVKLIYSSTRFWNASGVEVSGGVLSGMTVRAESMESLLTGGIDLATPEAAEMGAPAYPGEHFQVSETVDEAWLKWQPKLPAQAEKQERRRNRRRKNRESTCNSPTCCLTSTAP